MSVKGAAQGQQGGDANAMSDDAWASLISMSPSSGMSNDIGVRAKRLGSVWAEYGALYRLTATDNVKRATRTFFAKHVTPPYNLVKGASWHRKVNSYEVEAFFYNALAPGLLEAGAAAPVPRPVCVQVHKPKSFVFLLEDVKPAFPRQCDILTYDETLVALGWLAAYHAHFWVRAGRARRRSAH